ncbi:response regulator transcription factor [Paenibacillus xylaniclasticus]|uniref:response regulator transcription factor n=1 Tax=Paenibacillus xylaniclasticus TaxID=588083 RepID=UPI000FD9CA7D|nr:MULTISPECIES: response regulator transcription factor [Paenibacillus]GFN33909.1 DNA-binding response regulator [Paenibacillus curdlanolyticus]
MVKIKVMIVEDQEIIRKSLGIVLNLNPDIEIVGSAENGAVAVELVPQLQPEVILMDVQMPIMGGVEATDRIKKSYPTIKIIMLTTFQDEEIVLSALNAGAEGYILKAIDPTDLAAAIVLVHRGETMISQDVAKALFARTLSRPSTKETEYGLTERETQVLKCIAEGLSNRDISTKLFLSEGTVKNYISSIYSKLNVHNRATVMKKAHDEKLI